MCWPGKDFVVYLCIFSLGLLMSCAASGCESQMAECWQPLVNAGYGELEPPHLYMDVSSYLHVAIPPEHKRAQWRYICDLLLTVHDCYELLYTECSGESHLFLLGLKDAQIYMCDSALKVFVNHQSCLNSAPVWNAVQTCSREYIHRVDTADGGTIADNICKWTRDLVDCGRDGVKFECGRVAADFYHTYTLHLIDHVSNARHCEYAGLEVWELAVIGVAAGLVAVTLIWIGIVFSRVGRDSITATCRNCCICDELCRNVD